MRGARTRPPTPSRMNGAISKKSGSWTELPGGGGLGGSGGSSRARRVSVDEGKITTSLNVEGSRRASEEPQQKSSRSERGDGEGMNVKVGWTGTHPARVGEERHWMTASDVEFVGGSWERFGEGIGVGCWFGGREFSFGREGV